MAQRDPIITLCDYHNGIGFQIHPDEFRRYINKGNVEESRKEMHRQLDIAMDIGSEWLPDRELSSSEIEAACEDAPLPFVEAKVELYKDGVLYSTTYNSKEKPVVDISTAIAQAKSEGKGVLTAKYYERVKNRWINKFGDYITNGYLNEPPEVGTLEDYKFVAAKVDVYYEGILYASVCNSIEKPLVDVSDVMYNLRKSKGGGTITCKYYENFRGRWVNTKGRYITGK